MSAYPPLAPLTLVIKVFLRSCGLNEVANGGLSSFSITNMVLAHLLQELQVRFGWGMCGGKGGGPYFFVLVGGVRGCCVWGSGGLSSFSITNMVLAHLLQELLVCLEEGQYMMLGGSGSQHICSSGALCCGVCIDSRIGLLCVSQESRDVYDLGEADCCSDACRDPFQFCCRKSIMYLSAVYRAVFVCCRRVVTCMTWVRRCTAF